MTKANTDIRAEVKAEHLSLWQIAEALNISEPTMTRKLRKELSADEKAHIRAIIVRLKSEGLTQKAGVR